MHEAEAIEAGERAELGQRQAAAQAQVVFDIEVQQLLQLADACRQGAGKGIALQIQLSQLYAASMLST